MITRGETMKIIIGIISIIIMAISCDIFDTQSENDDNTNYSIMITDNIIEGSFYIDLATSSETTIDGTWQISFQMLDIDFGGQTYPMPNLVLNTSPGTIMAAIYNNISFFEFSSIPTTFSVSPYADALTDLTSVQYGGDNEVIGYNMSTHVVSINNPNEVLLVYSMITHQTWKIQFVEYNDGVVLLNFAELE